MVSDTCKSHQLARSRKRLRLCFVKISEQEVVVSERWTEPTDVVRANDMGRRVKVASGVGTGGCASGRPGGS